MKTEPNVLDLKQIQEQDEVLRKVVADFDRRRAKPWGRFLLWLLRHTT